MLFLVFLVVPKLSEEFVTGKTKYHSTRLAVSLYDPISDDESVMFWNISSTKIKVNYTFHVCALQPSNNDEHEDENDDRFNPTNE
jgi:hypothetical protein